MTAISASMTTFASQNLGAKRPDRIVQGLRIGSRLSISWAVFVCIFLFFASPALVSFLASSTDGYLIENGSLYLQISSAFYPILSLLLIYRNCLQGYKGVILCEPLIWVAMTVQLYFSLFRHPLIKEGKAILATKVQS
ncbi:damage inducible DinF protein [Streptococcus pneumoniae]|nr:damage inducible DinF protein [Streptococcus pneumoniae]